jgi:hypothetical protein
MPVQPDQIHRDRALENVSLQYKPQGMIADLVAPRVPVKRESDFYYVYSRDTMTIPSTRRAMRSESNQANWNMSTSTYNLEEHALHDYVSDRERDNADSPISVDVDTTEILTQKLMLRREKDLASVVQTTANWGTNIDASATATIAWSSNTTTTNPITLIDSLSSVILQNSGVRPNRLILTDPQFNAAKEHVSIVDRIKYTSADSVTPEMLAKLFRLDQILVATAIENTAKEGIADSMAFIWTDAAFLYYVPDAPALKQASALYTFWKDAVTAPWKVERWREGKRTSDAIQVSGMYQHKPVATACAALLVNIV